MLKNLAGNNKFIAPILTIALIFCLLFIIALVIALNIVNTRLNHVALAVEEIGEQHIITNVALNTNLPINSKFKILDDFKVDVNMFVETEIPIHVEIPVNENILVPFKIGVKDYVKLDTTIMITDDFYAFVEDTIFLDQKFTIPTSKRRGITLPVKASVPLKERVKIHIDQPISVHSLLPVDLVIIDTLPVGLSIKVPVNLKVPVRIPISTIANISFPNRISVVSDIPVSLNVPIDVALSDTDLAPYFKKIADGLRGLTKINSTEHDTIKKELN